VVAARAVHRYKFVKIEKGLAQGGKFAAMLLVWP